VYAPFEVESVLGAVMLAVPQAVAERTKARVSAVRRIVFMRSPCETGVGAVRMKSFILDNE